MLFQSSDAKSQELNACLCIELKPFASLGKWPLFKLFKASSLYSPASSPPCATIRYLHSLFHCIVPLYKAEWCNSETFKSSLAFFFLLFPFRSPTSWFRHQKIVVFDTLVFELDEYFVEFNQAKFKFLNQFSNWNFREKRLLNNFLNWIFLHNWYWILLWIEFYREMNE